jgi:mono/diheme cytochrome c family protein
MKIAFVILTAIVLTTIPLSLWSQGTPDGADIYKTRCAACHGSNGEGLPGAKIPAVKSTLLTPAKIVALITTGEGGKTVHATPIVNINKEQAKAIADHVKSFK